MAQTGKNILVAFKKESSPGVAAGASGGTILRLNPSPGLDQARTLINPNEFRKDGQRPMGRHGGRSVTGSYEVDMVVGAHEDLYGAINRANVTALLAITSATYTTITITGGANIVWAGGSPIAAGLKVGDIFRLSGAPDSGNNNRWLRVKTLSATTVTVYETLINNAVASGAYTLTRPKKYFNPPVPVRQSFTVEEYLQDIDDGEQFLGVRFIGASLAWAADQMARATFTALGMNSSILGSAAAPYFSAPTLPTGNGLVATDMSLALNGANIASLTGMTVNLNLGGAVQSVIGSPIPPDVSENDLVLTGTVSGIRNDMSQAALYMNEVEFELHALLQTITGVPPDALSFFFPRIKLTSLAAPVGSDASQVETYNFIGAVKDVTSGYDAATAVIESSAP